MKSHFTPVHNLESLLLAFLLLIGANFWIFNGHLFARGVTQTKAPSKLLAEQVPILGFHDIVDLKNPKNLPPKRREFDSDYTKQDLEIILTYLLQNNYWFLSTQEFYEYFLTQEKPIPSEQKGKKPILISFDDGYQNLQNNLLPLLESLEGKFHKKIKVVLFINPGLMETIDADLTYLSCDDLRDGFQKGFYDIQSHGLSHLKMTTLNVKVLDFELSRSKLLLKQCLKNLDKDKTVAQHLAFPFGATNEQVEKYTTAHYRSAYLYDNKCFEAGSPKNNKYRINRLMAYRSISPQKIIEELKKR